MEKKLLLIPILSLSLFTGSYINCASTAGADVNYSNYFDGTKDSSYKPVKDFVFVVDANSERVNKVKDSYEDTCAAKAGYNGIWVLKTKESIKFCHGTKVKSTTTLKAGFNPDKVVFFSSSVLLLDTANNKMQLFCDNRGQYKTKVVDVRLSGLKDVAFIRGNLCIKTSGYNLVYNLNSHAYLDSKLELKYEEVTVDVAAEAQALKEERQKMDNALADNQLEVEELRNLNAELQDQAKNASEAAQAAQAKLDQNTQVTDVLKQSLTVKDEELAEVKQQLEQVHTVLSDLKGSFDQSVAELKEREDQITQLQAQLKSQAEESQLAKYQQDEILKQKDTEIVQLQQQLRDSQKGSAEEDGTQVAVAELELQVQQLQLQVQESQCMLSEVATGKTVCINPDTGEFMVQDRDNLDEVKKYKDMLTEVVGGKTVTVDGNGNFVLQGSTTKKVSKSWLPGWRDMAVSAGTATVLGGLYLWANKK